MHRPLFYFIIFFAATRFMAPALYGQVKVLESFTLSAGSFYSSRFDSMQVDWRLDLGLTAIQMNHAPSYLFTAGFFQPTIDRFTNNKIKEFYDPKIQLLYNDGGHKIFLFSNETDLVIYGFQIFDLYGRLVLKDQSKFASSYLRKSIDLTSLTTGVYFINIFYLPESNQVLQNNYWTKSLKLMKQ